MLQEKNAKEKAEGGLFFWCRWDEVERRALGQMRLVSTGRRR